MKAVALLSIATVLMAGAPPAHRLNTSNRPLEFVDAAPQFDRIWQQTKALPDEQRVETFQSEFERVLPGFYSAKRVSGFIKPERYRAMILQGLKDYPQQRTGIRRVSRRFIALSTPARREFEGYFGPMRGYPPIYLVHSFGEFDGVPATSGTAITCCLAPT